MIRQSMVACGGIALVFLNACTPASVQQNEKNSATLYLQLGERYFQLDKLAIAHENLMHALSLDAENAQVYQALALLNEKRRHFDEAHAHYENALQRQPNDMRIQNNYGRFLCQQGQWQQGITLLEQAVNDVRNDHAWQAMTNMGVCYRQQGDRRNAEHYFITALQLNAAYLPALVEMQKICDEKGDTAGAQAYLMRYQRQILIQFPHAQDANTFNSQ
ncbi:MAG TPA: type IV pilus biogenesis/stability protein PilW [Methylococcaceae bacterium]|nr:type IV pilus biogenesis/stability protein PilW [Methylococcaceae bacterium]